jgi:hypothetical protein
MRAPLVLVLCSTLGACSAGEPPPPMDYIPPSVPALPAADAAVKTAIAESKLIGAVEISDFRPTDFGPGRFVACIRGTSSDSRTNTYAAFFNNNTYLGVRLPVGSDDCEHQNYHPFVPYVPPAKPVPKKPLRRART